jgi:hypothetical protein
MSDKFLTEREWKNFAKGQTYKADLLSKALVALANADKAGAPAQLKALSEVEKQSDILLKAHKVDKALVNYLGELSKAAAKARKEAEQAQQAQKDAAARQNKDEDDEDDHALLDPGKLLTQLNLCKRDPERKVQFGFVDAKDERAATLALSPRVAGRKLFSLLQTATGVKTGAFGLAWLDGTVLMLQLDKPLSGLVKKVRAPVKACGFRITKAVLWNADGSVFEQDEDGAPVVSEQPSDDLAAAFKSRLAALVPKVQAAAAAGHPAAKDITLKVREAGASAQKKAFGEAHALLDDAEALMAPLGRGDSGTSKAEVKSKPKTTTAEAGNPTEMLKQEGQAALEAATRASSTAAFVKSLETLRIKADLLAGIHADRAGARALVSQAFDLVRQRQGRDGFNASEHPEIGKLTDRAFKFGVLKGGLKGGAGGRALLEEAVALSGSDGKTAFAKWQSAFQAAVGEQDPGLVHACADVLRELGRVQGNANYIRQAAELARKLGRPDAMDMGRQAVELALTQGAVSTLIGAVEFLRLAGAPNEEIVAWCQRSAALAVEQDDLPQYVAAGEVLLQTDSPPMELTGEIGTQAVKRAVSGADADACLMAGQLLLKTPCPHDAEDVRRGLIVEAANRAAALSMGNGDSQGMVNAAQLLADAGENELAAQMAGEMCALVLKEPPSDVAADSALDAVKFLCGLADSLPEGAITSILALSEGTAAMAATIGEVGVQVDLAAAVLDLDGRDSAMVGATIAQQAAGQAWAQKESHPGHVHAALLVMQEGARTLAVQDPSSDAPVGLALASGDMALGMATSAQARGPEGADQLSMAGALMLDAAAVVVAAPRVSGEEAGQAIGLASRAGEIACSQVDTDQALKAAGVLVRAGRGDLAQGIAGQVVTIERDRLMGSMEAGDSDAFLESAARLLHVVAVVPLDGDAQAAVRRNVAGAAAALFEQSGADLDACQSLCEVMRQAGKEDVIRFEAAIAAQSLERAAIEAKSGQYAVTLTLLQTALQNDPGTAAQVADVARNMSRYVLDNTEGCDEEAVLDAAYLLLEAAAVAQDEGMVTQAFAMADELLKRASASGLEDVALRALQVMASAQALVQPSAETTPPAQATEFSAVTDKSVYNYQDQIDKVKKFKDATVVHYTSAAPMTAEQRKEVDDFAELATKRMHAAAGELVRGAFDDWDEDGSHLVQMLNLQKDWEKVGKDKALLYDLQKLRTVQAKKPLEKKPYNNAIEAALTEAGWPDEFDEDHYIALRQAAHEGSPKARAYAEGRGLNMLHTVAGYLIEERTYQLLPPKDEVPWTEQDTSILGGGTRPDIVLPVTGSPGKVALLDITASNSQGHIFNKRPAWTKSQKVCDSIEVLYASMDHGTLLNVMLEKQSFSPEEVERRRLANQEKLAAKGSEEEVIRQKILGVLDKLGNTAFKRLLGKTDTPAKHLLKRYKIKRTGFDASMALNATTAAQALATLDAYLQAQATLV